MHAIHLLGNCVNITNTSRNNEFFITPSTTIPAVFELNFYSNGVLHVFIKEAIIGMFWGLPRKDFLVTHEVEVSAQKTSSVFHVIYFYLYLPSLLQPMFTLTKTTLKWTQGFLWNVSTHFSHCPLSFLEVFVYWSVPLGSYYENFEPTWQNLCFDQQYFNEILFQYFNEILFWSDINWTQTK